MTAVEKGRDRELVYKVVTLFFAGKNASQIRDALRPEYGDDITRESIYPMLASARRTSGRTMANIWRCKMSDSIPSFL